MPAIISMLRGVNVGPHNRMKMDALRAVYQSLKLGDVRTYVQSGNVVFRSDEKDLAKLGRRIEDAIERTFGFRPAVILRTTAEMREAVARNPFAGRGDIEPDRLLVTFLSAAPAPEALAKVLQIKAEPEELRIAGREVYIYYRNGLARPKLSWIQIAEMLGTQGTGRNWNSVTKLLEMAEVLEGSA